MLGDFKKFTSKKIVAAIQNNPGESRKEWMRKLFREAGELNSRNTNYLPIRYKAIGMETG